MTYSYCHKDCAAIVTILQDSPAKGGGLDGVEFQVQDLIQGRAGSSPFSFLSSWMLPGLFLLQLLQTLSLAICPPH